MKKLIIFTAAILLFATRAFAQETSERDYVDEKDMSVTEVEELIQSKGLIHRLDFVFGIEPTVSINTHKKNSQGKFISAPSPVSKLYCNFVSAFTQIFYRLQSCL